MQIVSPPTPRTRIIPRRGALSGVIKKAPTRTAQPLTWGGPGTTHPLSFAGSNPAKPGPGEPGLLEKIITDVASVPGGLWDLINQVGEEVEAGPQTFDPLKMGDVTADVTEQAIRGTVENWRHPGRYFEEHPGFLLMDLAAAAVPAAKLGRGVLGQAAARADVSIPEFLSSETGAIGPFGRRLESGELPTDVQYIRNIAGTASSPSLGSARFSNPSEAGQVLMKKTGGDVWSQGEQEIASMELNRLAGGRLRLPGVQEHPAIPYGGGNPRPGALIEHVEEVSGEGIITPKNLRDLFARSRRPSDMTVEEQLGLVRQDLRDIGIFDAVTGNPDRWFRQNVGAYGGRPLAYDQGLALNSRNAFMVGRRPGDFFAPTSVWEPKGSLGFGELTSDELNWLDQLEQVLQNPSPSLMRNAGPDALRQAIERTQQMRLDRNIFSPGTSIPTEVYARRRITGGEFPDEAAVAASRLVQELRDAAQQGSPPGPGNWFGHAQPGAGQLHGPAFSPSSAAMDQAMVDEARDLARAADEFPGDEIDQVVADGIKEALGPPPVESQFPTPTPPPGTATANQWIQRVIRELDQVLDVGERELMRDVVMGFENANDALDWLRRVWSHRGQGPFPVFRIGTQQL